jgi:hypothetical protein
LDHNIRVALQKSDKLVKPVFAVGSIFGRIELGVSSCDVVNGQAYITTGLINGAEYGGL